MKPDWKDAPEWANYLAMDGDGEWSWFEDEPWWDESENQWYVGKEDPLVELISDGPDCDGEDWDFAYSTLEPRP